jgi:hypothetical protein
MASKLSLPFTTALGFADLSIPSAIANAPVSSGSSTGPQTDGTPSQKNKMTSYVQSPPTSSPPSHSEFWQDSRPTTSVKFHRFPRLLMWFELQSKTPFHNWTVTILSLALRQCIMAVNDRRHGCNGPTNWSDSMELIQTHVCQPPEFFPFIETI